MITDALIKNFPANHDQYCEVLYLAAKKKSKELQKYTF